VGFSDSTQLPPKTDIANAASNADRRDHLANLPADARA
jgi:hypothetical protein